MRRADIIHGLIFSILSVFFVFLLHHLPLNQMFIDPFSEAIKNHDVMDIAISKFRNHEDASLFDEKVVVINSGITDREELAHVIDFLNRHQVGAIGIDLLFDSLHHDKADTLLAQSLKSNKIVLGFTFNEHKDHKHESITALKSAPFFTSGNQHGYVNLGSNDGFSVRAFEPLHKVDGTESMSFGLKVASIIDVGVLSSVMSRENATEWINFRRYQPGSSNMIYPINSKQLSHYAYYNIKDFIKDTAKFEGAYFKNKAVLIGFCGENPSAISMKDRYFTPLNEKSEGRSIPDMHGVVVHANIISMLLKRDFISEVPEFFLYFISFLIFFANYLLFSRMARKKYFFLVPLVRLIQALQFVFLFALCIFLLAFANVKLGFILIVTAMILSFELFEFYGHKLRNRLAQWVNKILEKSAL